MSLSDELLTLSSVEMRRRIGTKEISPVELVEASIARIEALNPAVNASTITPTKIAAATAQLSTNAAGFAHVTIRPLLSAEEMDQAVAKWPPVRVPQQQ